jgi:V8-like Glu-specific endopeptidase
MGVWEQSELTLNGAQREQLMNALLSAFPTMPAVDQLVTLGLDSDLGQITGETNRRNAIFDLIRWAIAQGRLAELVVVAHERVPRNPPLRAFADSVRLAPGIIAPPEPGAPAAAAPTHVSKAALEKVVNKAASFANVDAWLGRMSEVVLTVCRVETPTSYGTGFLVGPDLVITNHHVVSDILGDKAQLGEVILRFDYRSDARGLAVRPGVEYRLATDRAIIGSPFADLDFALLPVEGSPGNETIGGQSGAPERKWLTPKITTFEQGQPLFVVQHPQGEPMKVAFDVVTGWTGARLHYRTNTEGGSSGSPCFNDRWELVALHHAAGEGAKPEYNQGIPFSGILARADVRAALGIA